ncbi:MAG TPA: hypothetical protein PKM88_12000 [bacterium]|nr:hypothetical protein [bacterium]
MVISKPEVAVELGENLACLTTPARWSSGPVDGRERGNLLHDMFLKAQSPLADEIGAAHARVSQDCGFTLPPVTVRINRQLAGAGMRIVVNEIELLADTVPPDIVLAMKDEVVRGWTMDGVNGLCWEEGAGANLRHRQRGTVCASFAAGTRLRARVAT